MEKSFRTFSGPGGKRSTNKTALLKCHGGITKEKMGGVGGGGRIKNGTLKIGGKL